MPKGAGETRTLTNVTPLHAPPKAYAQAAPEARSDDRYPQYSQSHKTCPTPKGPLTVVEGSELTLKKGEFVSLIGPSGCGKSTVLTMTAGLNDISRGAIVLDGRHVEGAGRRAVAQAALCDEPFGMLDSLTRWELQDVLMEVWSRTKVTAVCVTHDVDEAIRLADRVVRMTNGPQAIIGKVMNVDLPRPRSRKALLEHPDHYA